jgi:hypothetical protein
MNTEWRLVPMPGYQDVGGVCIVGPDNLSVADCDSAEVARLLVAAPDMLRALKRALPWIGKMIANNSHIDSVAPNDCVGAMHMMIAAIKRAEEN